MSDRAHNMTARVGSWPYCKTCGLIALRNAATRSAVSAACPGPRDQRLTGDAAEALWSKLRKDGWR
jgi:hypothetical protein